MEKETIVCIVLVIAIIIGNYRTQNYTKESVKELSEKLNDLKENIFNKLKYTQIEEDYYEFLKQLNIHIQSKNSDTDKKD